VQCSNAAAAAASLLEGDSLCCVLLVGEDCWWATWAADGGGGGARGAVKESTVLDTPSVGGAVFRGGADEVFFSFEPGRGEPAGVFWGVCPFGRAGLFTGSEVVCEDAEDEAP
jgi:hypothetical protein